MSCLLLLLIVQIGCMAKATFACNLSLYLSQKIPHNGNASGVVQGRILGRESILSYVDAHVVVPLPQPLDLMSDAFWVHLKSIKVVIVPHESTTLKVDRKTYFNLVNVPELFL